MQLHLNIIVIADKYNKIYRANQFLHNSPGSGSPVLNSYYSSVVLEGSGLWTLFLELLLSLLGYHSSGKQLFAALSGISPFQMAEASGSERTGAGMEGGFCIFWLNTRESLCCTRDLCVVISSGPMWDT